MPTLWPSRQISQMFGVKTILSSTVQHCLVFVLLLCQDMDPILALLETHDFISYQEKGLQDYLFHVVSKGSLIARPCKCQFINFTGEPGQACSSAFSSNLLVGRTWVACMLWLKKAGSVQIQGYAQRIHSRNNHGSGKPPFDPVLRGNLSKGPFSTSMTISGSV